MGVAATADQEKMSARGNTSVLARGGTLAGEVEALQKDSLTEHARQNLVLRRLAVQPKFTPLGVGSVSVPKRDDWS